MGLPLGSSSLPSFPGDLQVIRELSTGATVAHNFAVPRPSNKPDELSNVTYDYLCDARCVGYNGSAIITDCLSKLLSINDTLAQSEVEDLKGRVELAVQTLNWKQKDARPVHCEWIEQSMIEGPDKSFGKLTIRLGANSRTFGSISLNGTPQGRLLQVWKQRAADGSADARWDCAAASHQSTSSEREGSSKSAERISTASSAPINVSGAPNPIARTLRRSTRIATSSKTTRAG